ncbi:MAG TPA: MFS transporter [Desulfobacterales bacterium]
MAAGSISPIRITLTLCAAEILCLVGIATFPALVPSFIQQWGLSNTEAGWISAGYYAGYMLAVPVLVGWTDRIDARRILVASAALGALGSAGFALLASGFGTALLFRFFTGISLAGIYMPGLKIVSDHTEGRLQSRFVAYYTASFSIGLSVSYLLAGEIAAAMGWRWAFGAAAFCSMAALALVVAAVPTATVRPTDGYRGLRQSFGVVFRCAPALGYIFGYAAHMWELFSVRSWIVAYLAFSLSLQPAGGWQMSATQVAFWVSLIGVPASIGGNELARRSGRKRVIAAVMLGSAAVCVVLGFHPAWPFYLVVLMTVIHGITVVGDSAALTAGAVSAAPPGYRGATLALHSTIGFAAAFLGPLVTGMVLDWSPEDPRQAWAMGFVCMAAGCALGPLALAISHFHAKRSENGSLGKNART